MAVTTTHTTGRTTATIALSNTTLILPLSVTTTRVHRMDLLTIPRDRRVPHAAVASLSEVPLAGKALDPSKTSHSQLLDQERRMASLQIPRVARATVQGG